MFPWRFEQVRFSCTAEYNRIKTKKVICKMRHHRPKHNVLTCSCTGLSVYASVISISSAKDGFSISLMCCFCFSFFISLIATWEKMQNVQHETSNKLKLFFTTASISLIVPDLHFYMHCTKSLLVCTSVRQEAISHPD